MLSAPCSLFSHWIIPIFLYPPYSRILLVSACLLPSVTFYSSLDVLLWSATYLSCTFVWTLLYNTAQYHLRPGQRGCYLGLCCKGPHSGPAPAVFLLLPSVVGQGDAHLGVMSPCPIPYHIILSITWLWNYILRRSSFASGAFMGSSQVESLDPRLLLLEEHWQTLGTQRGHHLPVRKLFKVRAENRTGEGTSIYTLALVLQMSGTSWRRPARQCFIIKQISLCYCKWWAEIASRQRKRHGLGTRKSIAILFQ